MRKADVLIIGAGPAGSVAATMLACRGLSVVVVERSVFPRFAIGEGLLPQSTVFLESAGLVDAVRAAGFQPKNGATVTKGDQSITLAFEKGSACGNSGRPGNTWQVERAHFDMVLAEAAMAAGADVHFGETINAAEIDGAGSVLRTTGSDGTDNEYRARFVLDASGAGRVLPRQLGLQQPSDAPPRAAIFTHVDDHITDTEFDRHKTLLRIHHEHQDIWYWLIPFRRRLSLGVVGPIDALAGDATAEQRLRAWVDSEPWLAGLLAAAEWNTPVREMRGYAASVSRLCGPGYALLGNAGEAVDPVFSSGVTLAMKSAVLAAELLPRQLDGETVDWENEFERPLRHGAGVFRVFIESWYSGELQKILFAPQQPDFVFRHLCAILAGYVWDADNPYVHKTRRRLETLAKAVEQLS